MQGCLAPSEIPGVPSGDASVFGGVAEDLIYADFLTHYSRDFNEVFRDAHNPAAYLYFLAVHNPRFTQARQEDYYRRVRQAGLMRIPDFLVHTAGEKAFYEVKPESPSGLREGAEKVGYLGAIYRYCDLPYTAGVRFTPRDHTLATLGTAVRATLKVQRAAPGLIVYKICLDSEGVLELATLALLLRLIVREVNKQKGRGRFVPVDLAPAFQGNQQLEGLARTLGISLAATAAAVGWKYFWKAVVARFALRGATAATLAAADGPLPIGDLVAAGLAIWTIVDVIRLSDELWRDAAAIARREA